MDVKMKNKYILFILEKILNKQQSENWEYKQWPKHDIPNTNTSLLSFGNILTDIPTDG